MRIDSPRALPGRIRCARRRPVRRVGNVLTVILLAAVLSAITLPGPVSLGSGISRPSARQDEVVLSLAAVQRSTPLPGRQLWVWKLPEPHRLISLASVEQIRTLLLWVSPGFSANPNTVERLRRIRSLALVRGISLHALCGDPSWVDHPGVAAAWAREAAQSRLFSAVHVDVEPHSLPTWPKQTAGLSAGLVRAMAAAGAAGLPVEADVPAWYGDIPFDRASLLDAVLDHVAGITVMAYQNSATKVLASARRAVAAAGARHKPAFIGLNIASAGADTPNTTYLGQPATSIHSAFENVEAGARSWNGYSGIAVHDAEYLFSLDRI
jgi:hypothetical protein